MVGPEDGLLESGDPEKEVAAILRYILDWNELEGGRHHNALRPRPDQSGPSRPTIVWLLQWGDWQLILNATSQKKMLFCKGRTFHIFQNLLPEIQPQHIEYKEHEVNGNCGELGSTEGCSFYKTPD